MSKKLVMTAILIITAAFISGCVFEKEDPEEGNVPDFFPTDNLPSGFVYMGTHDTNISINGTIMKGEEGIYKYNDEEDIYIQVIENKEPANLIQEFKQRFRNANYDPFKEISFNGHKATQVKEYFMDNGRQVSAYSIVWATEEKMIIIGSSGQSQAVMNMAIRTGH